jgi:hypothetical protein
LVALLTASVVAVNGALVAPAGTVTVGGTVTSDGVPLVSDTTAPPLGAGPASCTVPCAFTPPTTLDGLNESVLSPGPTVRIADWFAPP